jgi:3-dehydroquinate dehydratase-2
MKVLVVHGAGMEMRGKVNVELFGPMTLDQYDETIRRYAVELGVDVDIFHSNVEDEVIAKLHAAAEAGTDAVLINPSGYMNGHPSLVDAIRTIDIPVYETHMSNPANRGATSQVSGACDGVITGFGILGYYMCLAALKR